MRYEENGSAAMMSVFTIFVILCSVLAFSTFEEGYNRQLKRVQQQMATDTTKAVAASVESELNDALETAIGAGMYEAGKRGQEKDKVVERLRTYFNERIEAGWSYSNFEDIYVPPSDESSLQIIWLPDGSLRAYGYLDATFTHVTGAKAYGVKLDAGVVPRYGRMLYLAYRVYSEAHDVSDIEAFEEELNNNYACECLEFTVSKTDGRIKVIVRDLYAGRAIAAEDEES
ncbi:MAG TPA: hypothetical protein ENF64_00830 [Hadesarchaea archaeon]|nr:hypothetical protein [Hadesarchaea archaeon]